MVVEHGQLQGVDNMPTAAGMPMPMTGEQGLASGFAMGNSLIQNLMNRQKMAQQQQQFMQELALKKQANARAAQAAADAHRKMDPMYEINQYRALENFIKGNSGEPGVQQMGMPTQEMGEGMGMFSPEGLQQAQQQSQAFAPMGGLNIELLKAHPMLRSFAKKHLGFDPLAPIAQTPEEKEAAQFDLFKRKEDYKAQQEPKPPAAVKTLHENIIQLSPRAIKAIQGIKDIPSPKEPWGTGALWADQKAAHHKAVTAAAENYAKAKGWPNTKGSIEKAESILRRGNYETDAAYRKRLQGYQDELEEGMALSQQFLHPNQQISSESTGGGDVIIEYVRRDGKLVPK
jgi:hypothetical protein